MILQSTSQAGQDVFAFEMCGQRTDGTFLDVGSYNLTSMNNTYALEQMGWSGLLFDILCDADRIQNRTSKFIQGDTTKTDWLAVIDEAGLPRIIDFLSLDCDDATLDTFSNIPFGTLRFSVATIEHDRYRIGDEPRDRMRLAMKEYGYDLACADVVIPDYGETEDWWCFPGSVNADLIKRVRCEGRPWSEIVSKLTRAADGERGLTMPR